MYAELGLGGTAGGTSVGVRQAYGTYTISTKWQLLAGHASSPFSPLFPSQLIGNSSAASGGSTAAFGSIGAGDRIGGNHNVGKGYGELDSGRNPQLRLTYTLPGQHGAIALALLDANQGAALGGSLEAATGTAAARSSKAPRIDIGAACIFAGVRLYPGISFQRQTYDGVGAQSDRIVRTSAVSLGIQTAKGPFEFSAEINAGRNWRNAGYSLGNSAAALGSGAFSYPSGTGTTTRIANTKSTAHWVDLGWRLGSDNTQSVIHLVYGAMKSTPSSALPDARDFEHQSSMTGISWQIDLPGIARGLTIRPEVFRYDEGRSKQGIAMVDYGRELSAGVQLQYTF